MAYTPTTWQNDPSTATPLSAANLQKMEVGIDEAHDLVDRFDQTAMIAGTDRQVLARDGGAGQYEPKSLLSTDIPAVVRETVTGTTYTTVLADQGKLKEFTNTGAVTLTINAVGNEDAIFLFRQYGPGLVTMVQGTATLSSRGGALKSAGQYAEWSVTRRGTTTEFIVSGDVAV